MHTHTHTNPLSPCPSVTQARSPNTTVVVWLDSFRIYTDNKTLNPDLGPACTTGHFRPARLLETHTEYLLKNSSGQPALE